MKKTIIIIFLVAILIFSSIVMVIGSKENNRYDNRDIKTEKKENVDLDKPQDNEEDENINLEEAQLTEESLMRIDSQNGIDVAVVFNNLLEDDKDYIVFKVMVNNHRVDLENIKYAELSKLRVSDGTVIDEGFQWKLEGGGGHHISGYLKLPKTYDGNDVINDNVDNIQLEIEGIGDARKLTFKWDKDVIDSYNNGGR
ncbi:hypothetical protein KQI38_15835 [Tissierella carlieri]|uniref:DUF4352 domain-containing protein n=1 Tax=Tissierella carlieri TaxID=689904 RepID=A0ABT1SE77_9FIRM|nr:hypothetical protein [Tissierella carlieri]MBU5313493.1 hypothetical protein [Tissierella carlieri]MCQ4924719.1 hypothetical protein [Tissierella carlieri]